MSIKRWVLRRGLRPGCARYGFDALQVRFDVLDEVAALSAAINPSVDAIVVATGFAPAQGSLPNPFLPWQVRGPVLILPRPLASRVPDLAPGST